MELVVIVAIVVADDAFVDDIVVVVDVQAVADAIVDVMNCLIG
jgi:hypothetical protein